MMKVLVTGSRGQLGSDLTPRLEGAGCEVRALASSELDVTDAGAVKDAVQAFGPGVVVNCAAYTAVDRAEEEYERAYKVNRDGAGNVARAAEEAGASVIHVSTDFVFDGARPDPYAEGDPTAPLGEYGRSKLAGEAAVRSETGRHVIVRTSWLYGSGGGGNFVKTILRLAAEREELRVVYDQTGSPTWTGDLAGAIADVTVKTGGRLGPESGGGDRGLWGIYHYSNEGVASWFDLAVAAVEEARALGVELACRKIVPIRTSEYPTPARRPAYSVLDKGKIKKTFHLAIPHWRVPLGRMVAELYAEKGKTG